MKKGTPQQLQSDVTTAIRAILTKYQDTWLGKNKDRIAGIVIQATQEALQSGPNQPDLVYPA